MDALKQIQDKQRELAQQRAEATEKLKDLDATRSELSKKKKEIQAKLAEAQRLLNTLTAFSAASVTATGVCISASGTTPAGWIAARRCSWR